MIAFKQYLIEARLAPLYHGTSYGRAMQIIESHGFSPSTIQSSAKLLKVPLKPKKDSISALPASYKSGLNNGVSTTRSYKFAKRWADAAPDPSGRHIGPVVFEFDQQKLSHNFEIKPISFYYSRFLHMHDKTKTDLNEYEEFIISNKIVPLKYVKTMYVPKTMHADFMYALEDEGYDQIGIKDFK